MSHNGLDQNSDSLCILMFEVFLCDCNHTCHFGGVLTEIPDHAASGVLYLVDYATTMRTDLISVCESHLSEAVKLLAMLPYEKPFQ